jgi:hypothetical protein
MGARGKKSAAEIFAPAARLDKRPPAPADLPPDQARLWDAIVSDEPQDWFATGARQHLLRLYCEHAAFRASLQELISDCKPEAIACEERGPAFSKMLIARDRETKLLASLATKLRLTNQARYTPQSAGTAGRQNPYGQRPWDTNDKTGTVRGANSR